jgi:hypothetical protein
MKLEDSATIAYSTEPEIFSVSALKNGAELLYEDYKNDKNLTEFSRLDGIK